MADLYDANGQPWTRETQRNTESLRALAEMGLQDNGDSYSISKDAFKRLRQERSRRLAITSVPSTPRHMMRDAGGMGYAKGANHWPHVSMEALRNLRDQAPILQPIHSARHYQIRRLCQRWPGKKGTVGYRVVHRNHHEHDAEQPDYIKPYIERFERMLESPSPTYECPTLGTFMTLLWEDYATINMPTVEVIHSAVDPSRIVQFRPVDGGIIWPTLLWVEQWKKDNPSWKGAYDPKYLNALDELDVISNAIDFDLHGAEYVLVREGIAEQIYRRGKLIRAPAATRTDIRWAGYPPGHVEQAIHLIAGFISTFQYNADYFTKGMLADFLIGIPADLHPDDAEAFVDMLRESTQGRPWQPPVIPIEDAKQLQKIDLKRPNTEMQFEVWMSLLIALCVSVYRMDTSTIQAKPWSGGSGPALSEGNRTQEIALSREEGLQGDVAHLTENILNPLARRCHPDLMVIWEFGDFDPQKEATIYEMRGRTDMTRNEIRLENGKKPMGFWCDPDEYETLSDEDKEKFDTNPWNWPTDPTFANAMSQQAMMAQQEEGMDQQPPGDGFGGEDDGFGGAPPEGDDGGEAPFGAPPGAAGPPGAPPGGPPPGPPPEAPPMTKGRTTVVHINDSRF